MLNSCIMFGNNYPIIKSEVIKNKNILHIKSKITSCKCPNCNKTSSTYHSTYIRKIQDTPIHNIETWLHVCAYEFECENKECTVKTFTEELPFARKNKVMTDALIQFVLSISIFLSSSATSLILSFLGVKVCADTVDNIIKKIKIVDNPNVEAVGIDDVAVRKGQTYATAIYDLNDHHLLALLEGRDAENLKEWLRNHHKIKIVARDRASSYATAISEILPNCTQVADRFHLFQNLVEHLKNIFYDEIPDKIFIKDNQIIEEKIKKVPSELTSIDENVLESLNYNNLEPLDELGNIIIYDDKKHDLDSKQYIEQDKRRVEKVNMIKRLRQRLKNSNCHETKVISIEFGISQATLRKYKKLTDEEVENMVNRKNYKKGKTLMDDYKNMIYKMLKDNISHEYIMAYVLKKGYKGSIRYLRDYINLIAKNNGMKYHKNCTYIREEYPNNVTVITRRDLLKCILTLDPKKEKDKEIIKYLDIIIERYPIVKEVGQIFKDFHDVIFSNDESLLDIFIEIHKDKVGTFCNGIKKDIAPIKNAISLQINSGFVEGNNNKFKLIKRIVYGKQKLCNLFKKSYLSFLATLDDFAIEEIVNNVLEDTKK